MNSLSELNTFSQTTLDLADDRGSRVVFNRVIPLQPLDTTAPITATTVSVTSGGNEIVEIINYDDANVRFRVRIVTAGTPALTGSTVTFSTLPSELTLTSSSGVYTITGIKTIAHWNIVKFFVWNLPANFASCPLWYLDIAVLYYDSDRDEEMVVDWEVYDPRFYYIAKFDCAFTQATIIGTVKNSTANLTSVVTLDCPGSRFQRASANISASSSITVNALDLDLATVNMVSVSLISVKITYQAKGRATISTISNLTAIPTAYKAITNMTSRNYNSNSGNIIFATSTPYIEDPSTLNTFTIELTSSNGTFGSSNDVGTGVYSFTGNYLQVNNQFPLIYFWPTKNYNSNTTFNYKQYKNGVLQIEKTVSLNYASAGESLLNYVFETNGTWTPTYSQRVYMLMDVYAVGGGGHGWKTGFNRDSSPGGNAGQVVSAINQSISNSSYAYTIGSGANSATQNALGGTTTFGSLLSASGGSSPTTGTVQGTFNPNVYEYRGGNGAGGDGASGPTTTGNNGSTVSGGAGGDGVTIFGYTGIAGGGGGGFRIVSTASTSSYTYNKSVGTDGGTNWGSGGTGGNEDQRTFNNLSDDISINAESGVNGVVLLQLHL